VLSYLLLQPTHGVHPEGETRRSAKEKHHEYTCIIEYIHRTDEFRIIAVYRDADEQRDKQEFVSNEVFITVHFILIHRLLALNKFHTHTRATDVAKRCRGCRFTPPWLECQTILLSFWA